MNSLKLQSGSYVPVNGRTEMPQISSKRSSFVFRRWKNVLRVWNDDSN